MAAYAVAEPGSRILDPACGAGALLRAALARGAGACVGVDLDDDAAAAARHELGEGARVLQADFLDLQPEDLGGPFDAVVANPPYLRQEAIPGPRKARMRRRFEDALGERVGGRLDLLGYFLLHLTSFLRPGGTLAFLSSAAWLTTGYGRVLRRFLAREYRIDEVTESAVEPWFHEARVRGVLVLARRQRQPPAGHRVIFRRLGVPIGETGAGDRRPVDQAHLLDGGSWGPHLRTPAVLASLRGALPGAWTELGDRARARFGLKSGADRFFVVRDGVDGHGRPWSGPSRALRPFLLSPMELGGLEVDPASLTRRLIVLRPDDVEDPRVAAHVAAGEALGIHRRPTCAARGAAWYALRPAEPPPIVWTRTVQYRHLVAANPHGALINNNLICLWPRDPAGVQALLVSLNSAWTHLERRARGRVSNEGKVKTEVGDLASMRVLDPAHLGVVPLELLEGRPIVELSREMDHPGRRRFERLVLQACGMPRDEADGWVERLADAVKEAEALERGWERRFRRGRNKALRAGCSPPSNDDGGRP